MERTKDIKDIKDIKSKTEKLTLWVATSCFLSSFLSFGCFPSLNTKGERHPHRAIVFHLLLMFNFRKPGTRNPEPGTRNPEPGTLISGHSLNFADAAFKVRTEFLHRTRDWPDGGFPKWTM